MGRNRLPPAATSQDAASVTNSVSERTFFSSAGSGASRPRVWARVTAASPLSRSRCYRGPGQAARIVPAWTSEPDHRGVGEEAEQQAGQDPEQDGQGRGDG